MKTLKTRFSLLSKDRFLRSDEKYQEMVVSKSDNIFSTSVLENIPLSLILREDYSEFYFEEGSIYKGIPTGQSFVDEDGDIVDYQLVTRDDHPSRLKYAVNNDNILISSIRLAKTPALMFENIDLSEYVFSNGFYVFKVNNEWNKKFVLYLLRTKKVKQLLDNNLYRGIGISAYKAEDLLKCYVRDVPLEEQTDVLKRIVPIEQTIRKLKAGLLLPRDIIDRVFVQEFGIDLDELLDLEKEKIIESTAFSFSFKSNMRFSFRWNKARIIQEKLVSMVDCCKPLEKYIIGAQNGWSPECDENATSYKVLSLDALRSDTHLNLSCVKLSDVERKDIEKFAISDGDFLVSRGNGSDDLVGTASIVHIQEQDIPVIYPDIMIRVDLSSEINKQYVAYAINSSIGRLFFKYVSKGSNKKKITPVELGQFILPIPDLNQQESIVGQIKELFDAQNTIKKQIESLRMEIDGLITETIVGGNYQGE